jgi:uncharacterized protein (DUF58 family)
MEMSQAESRITRLGRALHLRIPEVWVRFMLAILGLCLAFGAALFSTVSRESGNLWATLILASASLLLATVVGLTTVPYLARRVAGARLRDAFEYEVTRVGLLYVVVVLMIGVAALNTGNNLLYIVVAAMLSAILVSGVASAFALRELELEINLPEHVFAHRPTLARMTVRNRRTWVPSFSVNIVSFAKKNLRRRWRWAAAEFGFPPGRTPEKRWLTLPDRQLKRMQPDAATPNIFDGSVYFPYVPAGEAVTAELELNFERRGRYQQESFGLATRFPFAFLKKTRRLPLQREIVVYPSIEPADDLFEILPLIIGEFEIFARGRGYDLYRIREYMPEDSARHVDWKATAKSGSLKVREFSREDERKLRIVFDNAAPGAVSAEAYERAICLAASLAWHFAAENADITFASQLYNGGSDVHDFLRHLALAAPAEGASAIDALPMTGDYNLIFTNRPHGSIPSPLWACSYFIFMEGPS